MIVRQQVQPAVADVADGDFRSVDQQADDRRAHAAVVVAAFSRAEDAPVREADAGAQPVAVERQRLVETVRPGEIGVFGRSMNERRQRFNRQARRHFAGVVSAHAVGDREQAQRRVRDKLIFVRFADASRI